MRTHRSKPKSGWTPMGNRAVGRNYVLSLKAKGLLLTFLSQPDGGGMTVERLAYLHKAAAGLVAQTKERKDGRWCTTTAVSDTPEGLLLLLKALAPDSDFQGP